MVGEKAEKFRRQTHVVKRKCSNNGKGLRSRGHGNGQNDVVSMYRLHVP